MCEIDGSLPVKNSVFVNEGTPAGFEAPIRGWF
jgi:hypothetical protein